MPRKKRVTFQVTLDLRLTDGPDLDDADVIECIRDMPEDLFSDDLAIETDDDVTTYEVEYAHVDYIDE